MHLERLENAEVAVWGYGVEGQATCKYLLNRCPQLSITVLCPAKETDEERDADRCDRLIFNHQQVDAKLLSQFGVVVKSPGISPYQSTVTDANCDFTSSTALWFSNERGNNPAKVIAITGTKGKSTSCAMLASALTAMGHEVMLAGNFGLPLIQCLKPCDFLILETSSYQANDGLIEADLAVLLNLYAEHLNWHGSEAQYHADKWQLLQNAKHVVMNAKDKNSRNMQTIKPISTTISYFEDIHSYYELNHVLMYQDRALLSEYGWQLKGIHNLKNAAAVLTVITFLGLDIKSAINTIKQFKGLPHRQQTVAEINGVVYIDDSIASTPHATWAALSSMNLSQTILLVGGFDRGVDWLWLVKKLVSDAPKMIICSGSNGKKIQQLILNHQIKTQCISKDNLKQAVLLAKQSATCGDSVLLSPGAPSFDAFKDYQQRGQKFLQWLK